MKKIIEECRNELIRIWKNEEMLKTIRIAIAKRIERKLVNGYGEEASEIYHLAAKFREILECK